MSLQPARERVSEFASNFENGTSGAGEEWAGEHQRRQGKNAWEWKWNQIYHLLLRHQSWQDEALWKRGGSSPLQSSLFRGEIFFSLFIKQAGFYLPQRREVLMYIHLTEHARSLEGLLAMRGFSISLQQRTKENRLVGKCCHCSIANGSWRHCWCQSCYRPALMDIN